MEGGAGRGRSGGWDARAIVGGRKDSNAFSVEEDGNDLHQRTCLRRGCILLLLPAFVLESSADVAGMST